MATRASAQSTSAGTGFAPGSCSPTWNSSSRAATRARSTRAPSSAGSSADSCHVPPIGGAEADPAGLCALLRLPGLGGVAGGLVGERVAAQHPPQLGHRRRAGQLGGLGVDGSGGVAAHHRHLVLAQLAGLEGSAGLGQLAQPPGREDQRPSPSGGDAALPRHPLRRGADAGAPATNPSRAPGRSDRPTAPSRRSSGRRPRLFRAPARRRWLLSRRPSAWCHCTKHTFAQASNIGTK
jgi:hypothetical protein